MEKGDKWEDVFAATPPLDFLKSLLVLSFKVVRAIWGRSGVDQSRAGVNLESIWGPSGIHLWSI